MTNRYAHLSKEVVAGISVVIPNFKGHDRYTTHEGQSIWLQHKGESLIPSGIKRPTQSACLGVKVAQGDFAERV